MDAIAEIERLQGIIANRDAHLTWLTERLNAARLEIDYLRDYPL
jgi:hypothetical protein